MQIEFRQILKPIESHRVLRNLVCEFKTLLTFDYQPERKDPIPYLFKGVDLLKIAEVKDTFRAYIVGVEPGDKGKLNYHILENFQNILVVSKNTNFQLFDIVPIIK
jgi:hypothetical protein